VLLVNRFFGDSQTPTGRMLLDVAEQLAAENHHVMVLTSQGRYVPGKSSVAVSGKHSFELHFVRQWSSLPRLLSWLWFWLHAVVRVPLMKWDRCVLLTDPPFLPVASYVPRWIHGRSRRIVLWTMDLYPEALAAAGRISGQGLIYKALKRVMNAALTSADAIIALGSRQRERLNQYRGFQKGRPSTIIIPPWDERPLEPIHRAANPVIKRFGWQQRKVALYAGNLGEGHTYQEFVEAAKWLHDHNRSDWVFAFFVRGAKVHALRQATGKLPNVLVADYLSDAETGALLWAATVHLISMQPGWEGVIVPSKLYGVIKTNAPVMFVGPRDADTSFEISRFGRGEQVNVEADGATVAHTLDRLAETFSLSPCEPVDSQSGHKAVSAFITS
jgi:colanic acid biosynthesis glycosyl transferase WcaI